MERIIIRALLIMGVVSLLVYIFAREISHVYALHIENEKMKVEAKELVIKNDELTRKINFIEKDKQYVEKIIREELGMIKKGEKVYRFND
jgi:cell division protein FtsB